MRQLTSRRLKTRLETEQTKIFINLHFYEDAHDNFESLADLDLVILVPPISRHTTKTSNS